MGEVPPEVSEGQEAESNLSVSDTEPENHNAAINWMNSLYKRLSSNQPFKWIVSWVNQSLFRQIFTWVILAIVVFGFLAWWWADWLILRPLLPKSTDGNEPAQILEYVKTILPIIGGIGAVGYLVIKYQERNADKRSEEREIVDQVDRQMAEAIRMLGDKDAASTRIAGVYALADIADTKKGTYRQKVVNILCGYLRSERKQDNAVESTIIMTIREHLLKSRALSDGKTWLEQIKNSDQLWCDCTFDLHGATITEN
ncbi:MAG: hypothetical protein FWH40_03705 [Coriobacteriia bacterium]|nr:hypothetical protein [Coriobacteriia bacterium]